MLKDYPKEIILKDGTGVTLKPLQKGDRDLLFKLLVSFKSVDINKKTSPQDTMAVAERCYLIKNHRPQT